jgi:5-methylcytosine-specific restriction endonuclease McrA
MGASNIFGSSDDFAARLRSLRQGRRDRKLELRSHVVRKPLSRLERDKIFMKTAGRCHICGGLIEGEWQADHVFSHSLGGQHTADNYLPAHPICNNYRWFYGTEEFQWILKLGVWLRTQIETQTALGRLAAKAFCAHDRIRAGRRKTRNTRQEATAKNNPTKQLNYSDGFRGSRYQ